MAEGMLMYVRLDDPLDVRRETVGRAMCADDEIMLLDENDLPVSPGEVGEFCAQCPRTQRKSFYERWFLSLWRPDATTQIWQLCC